MIGCGGSDTRDVIHEIEKLPTDHAVAILSASPYYSKPSQEGLYQHYKAIAAASPIPVILYNVPARTARNVNTSIIMRLAELPNISGIKEAGGDMAQCALILRDRPDDFLVVSGDDALAFRADCDRYGWCDQRGCQWISTGILQYDSRGH